MKKHGKNICFQTVFSLFLQKDDLAKDVSALILLLAVHSAQDDFSDMAVIYAGSCSTKTAAEIEKTLEAQKKKITMMDFLELKNLAPEMLEKTFACKRFVFVLLPERFVNRSIKKVLHSIPVKNQNFTNLVLITTKKTKKVKAFTTFTSYLENGYFSTLSRNGRAGS